ncbi:hypothetical protein MMA231_00429 [Asticcacaulis sp. MM231]|jgi:hypothetical protein|uniref:excalibur calcium-binding domain-containing protein n=1 Tax=Asticcacaulis sp. MM231 TaxID=3157666 RepID=UPI0032D574A3
MTHGPTYGRREAEREAEFLRQRIGLASERARGQSEISHTLKVLATMSLIALAFYMALATLSPWPVGYTLRHMAAFTGCDATGMVHLAPAHRGQPGYWQGNDPDRNGIACD